jgi:hypothetical protein
MGMDVYGLAPRAANGEYFRNNVWWWHPLWDYVIQTTGRLLTARQQELGHTNSGVRISEKKALAIATTLDQQLERGEVVKYATAYEEAMRAIPDEPCELCRGTGARTEKLECLDAESIPRLSAPGGCNGCGGTGKLRPFCTHYPFGEENVREFASFCRHSGGFEVW